MASNDGLNAINGEQPNVVHLGTWYAGDLLDVAIGTIAEQHLSTGMAV